MRKPLTGEERLVRLHQEGLEKGTSRQDPFIPGLEILKIRHEYALSV